MTFLDLVGGESIFLDANPLVYRGREFGTIW